MRAQIYLRVRMNGEFIIPLNGLASGESRFSWHAAKEFFDSFENAEILDADIDIEVRVEKSGRYLGVDCEISGEVTVECDRCLDELLLPVDIEDQLVVKFSEEEEGFDGEVMWLNPADGQLDLMDWLYETVLLALPYQRVHASLEECNPEMVKHFRVVSEEEFNKLAEPQEAMVEGEMADKLAALKRQMEQNN